MATLQIPLRPVKAPSAQLLRAFSTSSAAYASTHKSLAQKHRQTPPYPYGVQYWYKQSNTGLYARSRVQFGHNVSERTETKTPRTWYPNVKAKRLYSRALERMVRVRLSARVLKTIDKVGGLDEYLLGDTKGRIKDLGMGGWRLRCEVMQTPFVRQRFASQRRALGLPERQAEAPTAAVVDEARAAVSQAAAGKRQVGQADDGADGRGKIEWDQVPDVPDGVEKSAEQAKE